MKALIDPVSGRVCQVEAEEFEVGPPFFWMDCASDVSPNTHGWSEQGGIFLLPPIDDTPQVDPWDVALRQVHGQFPPANPAHVNEMLATYYPGLKVEPVYSVVNNSLIGVSAHELDPNAQDKQQVLLSIVRSSQDRLRLGIPGFTFFVLTSDQEENQRYVEFMQNNGSTIVTVGERCYAYTPWSIEYAKNRKRRQIDSERDEAIVAGFTWGGHEWDADTVSRANLTCVASAVTAGIPLPSGFTWRTKDNQNVPVTDTDVLSLGAAMIAHVNTKYQAAWGRKAVVDAATTMEEVEGA